MYFENSDKAVSNTISIYYLNDCHNSCSKNVCAIIENRNSMLCILKASKSIKKQKISIKMQKMSKKVGNDLEANQSPAN